MFTSGIGLVLSQKDGIPKFVDSKVKYHIVLLVIWVRYIIKYLYVFLLFDVNAQNLFYVQKSEEGSNHNISQIDRHLAYQIYLIN